MTKIEELKVGQKVIVFGNEGAITKLNRVTVEVQFPAIGKRKVYVDSNTLDNKRTQGDGADERQTQR